MSKRANKQRMKRRLIDAICKHDPDLDFERAVMGNEFKLNQYTHKRLKSMLRLGAKYAYNNNTYASIDCIMVVKFGRKQRDLRWLKHVKSVTVSR